MATAATTAGAIPAPRASRGIWRDAFRRLLRNRPALFGLFLIGVFVAAAVLAPVIAPYGPTQGRLADSLKPPGAGHLFGTDKLGRDEFSRILYGAQISLYVGVVSVFMGLGIGGLIG